MFSLPGSSIMRCRWRWWSCHVIISYLFENACPTLVLPPIYAHSKCCDFKLKALCHNRSQQETSYWSIGQRECSFFFFLMEITVRHLLAPQDRNAPSAVWRICFITDLTGVCKHTVSICGASVGGEPWTTAWLVPCSGHGAAEWERAERQRGGKSQPALWVPKDQMLSENITQAIFILDCIFTSSSNSEQRLI